MRENQPEGANHIPPDSEDVKHLGVLITTTGVALLINADDTLEACQTLAASRSPEYGRNGPVDCVELLNEAEGLPFVGNDPENEPVVGVDMWIDDEGRLLDNKLLNPFASLMASQDIYGDVVLFGSIKGHTMSIPWPAFEKLTTLEWIHEDLDQRFISAHPTRGYWTVEEARVVIDSIDAMGREDIGPSDDSEEVTIARMSDQGKRNNTALMFTAVGFDAEDYRRLMDEAASLPV